MSEVLVKLDEAVDLLTNHRENMMKDLLSSSKTESESFDLLLKAKEVQGFILDITTARNGVSQVLKEKTSYYTPYTNPIVQDDTPEVPFHEAPSPQIQEYWSDISDHILNQLITSDTKTSIQIIDSVMESNVFPENFFPPKKCRRAVSTRIRRLKEMGLIEKVGDSRKILQLSEKGRYEMGLSVEKIVSEALVKVVEEVSSRETNGTIPLPFTHDDPTLFVIHNKPS